MILSTSLYPPSLEVEWWTWCLQQLPKNEGVKALEETMKAEKDLSAHTDKYLEVFRAAALSCLGGFMSEYCLCVDDSYLPEEVRGETQG